MITAVFEDDREWARRLGELIGRCTRLPPAVNTGSVEEMREFARSAPGAALYFLDIVKEGETAGFRLAEEISALETGSLLVFLTAYPQKIRYNAYFKTKAFSWIYKDNPHVEEEIAETIRLAEEALSGRCVLIHAGRFETLYLPYQDIYFIESVKGSGKLCIHAKDGQYVIRETLGRMEKRLAPHGFARCHRSVILRIGQATRIDRQAKTVFFPGGASCPYSGSTAGWMEGG